MKKGITSAFVLLSLMFAGPTFAAWQSSKSYVYFSSQGDVVGQSIQTCSTSNPRKASGQTSLYWREDSVLCSDKVQIIYGDTCYYAQRDESDVYPVGAWLCAESRTVVEEGGKIMTNTNHLPPGMTLEQSCELVGCDFREEWFIPELQAGIYTDSNNSSTPQNYP